MGKKHIRQSTDAFEDSVLMSYVDDDMAFEAEMQAMDRRNSRRDRRHSKAARNRFDDYEQEKWVRKSAADFDSFEDFEDELDFGDNND